MSTKELQEQIVNNMRAGIKLKIHRLSRQAKLST